jgi:hypothetical protein
MLEPTDLEMAERLGPTLDKLLSWHDPFLLVPDDPSGARAAAFRNSLSAEQPRRPQAC